MAEEAPRPSGSGAGPEVTRKYRNHRVNPVQQRLYTEQQREQERRRQYMGRRRQAAPAAPRANGQRAPARAPARVRADWEIDAELYPYPYPALPILRNKHEGGLNCFLKFASNILMSNDKAHVCSICISDDDETIRPYRKIIACGHIFHKTCIEKWFEFHMRCPMCRRNVIIDEMNRFCGLLDVMNELESLDSASIQVMKERMTMMANNMRAVELTGVDMGIEYAIAKHARQNMRMPPRR